MTDFAEKISMFLQGSLSPEKKRINTMKAMNILSKKYHVVFVDKHKSGFKTMVKKGNIYIIKVMKHDGSLLEVGRDKVEKKAKEIYNSLS